jgi:hypothetical protein
MKSLGCMWRKSEKEIKIFLRKTSFIRDNVGTGPHYITTQLKTSVSTLLSYINKVKCMILFYIERNNMADKTRNPGKIHKVYFCTGHTSNPKNLVLLMVYHSAHGLEC